MRPILPRTALAAVLTVILAVTFVLASPALAAGPNGGRVAVAEGHPIEFVASEREVTFFVTEEDGTPMDTAGVSAKAFVSAGGKTETLALKPAPPNRLVGPIGAPLAAGAKLVLSATFHGHRIQVRFEK